jgi:low temperature requirement protein LtrA
MVQMQGSALEMDVVSSSETSLSTCVRMQNISIFTAVRTSDLIVCSPFKCTLICSAVTSALVFVYDQDARIIIWDCFISVDTRVPLIIISRRSFNFLVDLLRSFV